MKLVPENLYEVQNFERGKDPKKSMDIGLHNLVKNIDSDDLLMLHIYMVEGNGTDEGFKINFPYWETEEELQELLDRIRPIYNLLKDHVIFPRKLPINPDDIASLDQILNDTLNNTDKKYAYDYTPAGDEYNIMYSDIELPSADNLMDIVKNYYEEMGL